MGRSWGGLWRRRRFRADRNLYLTGQALGARLVNSCAFRPVLLLSATFSRITLLATAEGYSGVLTPRMPNYRFRKQTPIQCYDNPTLADMSMYTTHIHLQVLQRITAHHSKYILILKHLRHQLLIPPRAQPLHPPPVAGRKDDRYQT
jgi:hypothetical protein